MRIVFAALAALSLCSCASIEYYAQAVDGHLDLMRRAVPIQDLLRDPATPPELKAKLARVLEIRDFASRALGLPDNGSYRRYADIGRPFAVWDVFAAPEFSVEPIEWCFLFAGCVAYRGYYSLAAAEREARRLAAQGDDVFVAGVPAYSTLGWFDDPVLSTFIRYPDAEIARLIFHELAHQVVYVPGDTVFNESFAVTVEEEGVRRWLARYGSAAERAAFEEANRRRGQFAALALATRARLATLYAEALAPEQKRAEKARVLARFTEDYHALRARWGGFSGFDRFFSPLPNNATLVSIAAYTRDVPAFRALLAKEGGDLPRFYRAVKELAKLDKPERDARLQHARG